MKDHRGTFADSVAGLELAFELSLSLRRMGHRTRLVTHRNFANTQFTVHMLESTPPPRVKTAFEKLNASLNAGRR